MSAPTQKGNTLVTKAAPTFTKFVVVSKTWKETDPLEVEETKDGNDETYNFTGANPGIDAACDWVIKNGQTAAIKMDVVVGTYPDTTTKKFMVMEVDTQYANGVPLKQSVKLVQRNSTDATLA